MEKRPNITSVCETCDYDPAFCDGDIGTCESAVLYGVYSEIGMRNGSFDEHTTERELDPFFRQAN